MILTIKRFSLLKNEKTILNKYFDLKKTLNQEIYTIVQNNV